jgi:PAS domain S-box-containing protein
LDQAPILIVDDDTVSRHVLCQALAQAQLPYEAVGSGTEALEAVARLKPAVVVLDLVMPPPDGYQVLRILRARKETRDLPVVVLTALDAEGEIARAFETGADDFVRKPFKAVELVARVRGQLRLHRAVAELARKEKDAQVVLELTQALASSLDFRDILYTVVQRIAEVAKVDRASIVLVREHSQVGYVVAASDDDKLRDLPIDLGQYPEIRQVLTTSEPLVIADTTTHPLGIDQHGGKFNSLAILPIVYEGKPMGVLFLRAKHTFAFAERELALTTTITNAMAIALRNARVLQSLRDQTQQVTVARFEAERKLRSLQRYADFFESSADGIVVIDTDGRLLFSNPKAREITGYMEEELRGRQLGDLFASEDVGLAKDLKAAFAQGHFPRGVDIRVKRKDGAALTLSINFGSVLREDGVVLCNFRDVTAERAVEAELVKTRNFLRRVIDSSVDAIVSADMRGRVLVFNRAAERIYGRTTGEILGTNVRQLYASGVAEEVMRAIRTGGGRVEGMRTEVVAADGEHVPVSVSAALLYEGDTPVGSVGIFTDLREKVRMEQKLAEAQEQLLAQERQAIVAELAGAAAHELNQPLTSVMGYAELLKRKLDRESPGYSAAEVIFKEAERMAEIVRKIGKITKYETKSYVGQARILDLDKASGEKQSEPKLGTASSSSSAGAGAGHRAGEG